MKDFELILNVLMLLVGMWSGYLWGEKVGKAATPEPQRDTLFVTDTFIREKPVPCKVYIHDTISYPIVRDSLIHDTTWVLLPLEHKEYKDTTYSLSISGVQPTLDWIETYNTTKVVYESVVKKEQPRWAIGVQGGYGVAIDGQIKVAPYIGIGVSYILYSR